MSFGGKPGQALLLHLALHLPLAHPPTEKGPEVLGTLLWPMPDLNLLIPLLKTVVMEMMVKKRRTMDRLKIEICIAVEFIYILKIS